jgi:uncharacterized Zn finger protein
MVRMKNIRAKVVKRKESLCPAGLHEFCTQSRNPPIVQCLNCGYVVTDFSNFTSRDFDNIEILDARLKEEKMDLYR